MSAVATRIESQRREEVSSEEIFQAARARETALSRLLMVYICTGLGFMLLPGTLLGVWNLVAISSRHAALSVSRPWIQAHGHAQIFGWVGCFILGIGFHSLPKLRRRDSLAIWIAWACWAMWSAGVLLRWMTGIYLWHWRLLMPGSAALELAAFLFFFKAVSGHKPTTAQAQPVRGQRFETWILVVIAATCGLLLTLATNLAGAIYFALRGTDPAFAPIFDQRFLVLAAWGFLVPFVWGFSAKWMPIFLGLKPTRTRLLILTLAVNSTAVAAALGGLLRWSAALLFTAAVLSGIALRLFEPVQQAAKTRGVHASFPVFVRLAYLWLIVAGGLGLWAAQTADAVGIWGASRHALTVGFVAMMIFCVGQRILPAFSGMRLLFSTRLMFVSLLLLAFGCTLRVASEVLAYQGYAAGAWSWLPVSAVTELTAVTVFAINIMASFASKPPSALVVPQVSK